MITQRIRKANDGLQPNYLFATANLFHGLRLNAITVYPSWLTETLSSGYISFITISSSPILVGEYTFYFTLGGSPPTVDACLIIEIVDSLTESIEVCSGESTKNISWITREGGRESMIFDQRIDQGFDAGDSNSYINNGNIRYTSRGKNYDTFTLFKSGMTRTEIDLISSLRSSIQAWEYDPVTDISTEIYLDKKSFDTYSTNEEFYEVSIDGKYSKFINTQVQ